jgi:DNA repair exonuclease SbcCD ATPase subunit
MFSEEINQLKLQIEEIESQFDNNENYDELENLENTVYELEERINEYLDMLDNHFSFENIKKFPDMEIEIWRQCDQLKKLSKRLSTIKSENDFYDKEAELDRMFPNRQDDDFDEDSMSYASIFGDD